MNDTLNRAADALRRRGFDAAVFSSAADAADYILQDVPAGADIAIGGSMSVKQMALHERLRAQGHTVLWHWEVPPQERPALLHRAMACPVYLCSANALTEDGLIVQIDGNGNRVAAICYGPQTVYVIIGRNKLVCGGYAQAVRRVKQEACPQNARRQGLDTPCASGSCNVGACKNSMCAVTAAFDRAPGGKRTQVVLVDEELGY